MNRKKIKITQTVGWLLEFINVNRTLVLLVDLLYSDANQELRGMPTNNNINVNLIEQLISIFSQIKCGACIRFYVGQVSLS